MRPIPRAYSMVTLKPVSIRNNGKLVNKTKANYRSCRCCRLTLGMYRNTPDSLPP
jgi:hypothetical protein